jgi:putative CocE/NonD family hydrolase
MNKSIQRLLACVAIAAIGGSALAADVKVSRPGQYQGYAPVLYDGFERSSIYVPMRDGTQVAVDVFRPTKGGVVASDKLPVIWMHTPYNRRTYNGGPAVERYPGYAIQLAKYGYNVAVADFRGVYASYGKNLGYNRGEWREGTSTDAYDLTEWLARQSYSTGKIGMWGCSATGGSQMQAATTLPPSLKAIIPMSAEFDAYSAFVVGGVSGPGRVGTPGATGNAVTGRDKVAVPVDGPDGPAKLAQAVASHAGNIDTPGDIPNRDSKAETGGEVWWKLTSPSTHLARLKTSTFGVMAVANWDEAGTRHGAFFTFNNLPKANTKLLVGPSTHCNWSAVKQETGFELTTEELRFYDYWLKGAKNGVMDEPAVTYFTYNAPRDSQWRTSATWPLANEKQTRFYLAADTLLNAAPKQAGADETVFGPAAQATSTTLNPAEGGLNYLTPVLTRDTEITGHPVVNLWLSTSAPDVDVTAWLHDIAPDGTARTYQMVGRLRASHRKLAKAPYNALGLPWHSFDSRDAQTLQAGQPAELTFDMLPMSYIFKAGHRIRLNLTFADPQRQAGAPKVSILRGPGHDSYITLPLIPARGG